uniref:Uncharacterized protein n=1 Tax=Romanomermis culicivorax TaxID=13658 RepID=A0A915J5R8_ROMCU
QDALKAICECSSQVNYDDLKSQYAACLSKRQFSVDTEKDYFPKWIVSAKSRYCNNSQKLDSQCGGFNFNSKSQSGVGGLANMNLNSIGSLFNTGGTGSSSVSSTLTNILSGISGLASSTGGIGLLGSGPPSSLCTNMAALSSLTNVLGSTDLLKG